MIISKTPYRISFFGGGTDYPEWYLKEGGAVLATSIDKYCYISCRYLPPYFNVKHRIVWSYIELVNSTSEILHPAVREGIRFLGFNEDVSLEVHHQGDLPARAGIGSSSSFAVGLIHAFSALKGEHLRKDELALKAIELEQKVLKENVGSQDQITTAYGGFNLVRFLKSGGIKVEPLRISAGRLKELEQHLMLFYTGTSRIASEIASGIIANLGKKAATLREIRGFVDEGISILNGSGDLDAFGKLLHEGWSRKQQLSASVTSSSVDEIYKTALEHGALGGKLLGAGGTGFMLFYVPLHRQDNVRKALSNYLHVPFRFENEGSTLIYQKPETPE